MKKQINFRTHTNTKPDLGKTINSPSKTIQGGAHTVQELFERAAIQGHFPIENSEPYYNEVDNVDEVNHMHRMGLDITDVMEHKEHLEAMQETVQKQILEAKSKASKELSQAKRDKKANDEPNDDKQNNEQ